MNNIEITILVILIFHWFSDFVLQTHKQAIGKSSEMWFLLGHTLTYSSFWIFISLFLIGINNKYLSTFEYVYLSIVFGCITFMCHTIQDYFTSRWVKKYFDKKNFHNGFVVIGVDQILHYLQLYITLKLLL